MVNIQQFKQKSTAVYSMIKEVVNKLPDDEDAEYLEQNYDEVFSMILDVIETLDCVLSDIEK